jgi:F-type H+-transporting ATPase subunit delta
MQSLDLRAARRYAGALFNLAEKRGEVDAVQENLKMVTNVAEKSPELMAVLHHPRITRARKKELLHHIFEGNVREDVEHFLFLLVERDRASIIPAVVREYSRRVDEYRGEVNAVAATAQPMSAEQIAALKARLEQATGLKVRLQTHVDEHLLGGMVVRVGDRMIDASIASRLQAIRDQLKKTKVT